MSHDEQSHLKKRENYLDKWKASPKKAPEPSPEAVKSAEDELAALEKKDKKERDKMHDGDVIKLH